MKRQSFLPVIMLGGLLLIGYQSCKHEPEDNPGPGPGPDDCDTTGVSYPGTVYPIFQANCISCHSGASPDAGIDLTDYAQVEVIAQNGQLLGAIKHLQGYSPMPKGLAQLDSCKIIQIEIWVRDTTFSEPNPNPDPCDPDTVYFGMDVLPILLSSCAISGCHDAVTAEDGIRLDSYAAVMASDVIVPYNPNESELFEKITETEPQDVMPPPPATPLAAAQIALIQKWISQGALDLYCQADCDTVNVTFSGTIWPQVIQKHCFGCHNGPNASGGIHLENHSQVAAAAAIPSGQPGSLWGAITHASGNSPMPKNQAQLSECKITQVKKWIDDGTPNN